MVLCWTDENLNVINNTLSAKGVNMDIIFLRNNVNQFKCDEYIVNNDLSHNWVLKSHTDYPITAINIDERSQCSQKKFRQYYRIHHIH